MAGSKMVLLVPDAGTRERVRSTVSLHPQPGLHVSVYIATAFIDGCVRDTRALFDGPLSVLARSQEDTLLALSAGADEAYTVDSFSFDAASWTHLVARAQLRSAARLEAAQRLVAVSELEKLCAFGRLAAGVAEELSNPLSSALISLELLQIELEPLYQGIERVRQLAAAGSAVPSEALADICGRLRSTPSTATRAHAMLAEVTEACDATARVARELGLGPHDQDGPQFFDLRRLVDKVLRLFERAAGRGTRIDRDYAEDLPPLFAARGRVAQMLIILLSNALTSVRAAPRDTHRLGISLHANERAVLLTISNTGLALTPEVMEHVFAPSANPSGHSSVGIELSVARSTLRGLGGDLLVESLGREGTTLIALLPRPKEREREAFESGLLPKPSEPANSQQAPRCVLVLEPDAQVLGALSRLLRERYAVMLALDASEGRRLLASGVRPDAILVAVDEPDGAAFVRWLFGARPELARRLLLTSAGLEPQDELSALPLLAKPLEPAALYRELEARFAPPLRNVRTNAAKPPRRAAG